MKAAALRKEKMQNIKAATLKTTGMKAAALEYVNLNLWILRPRRSLMKVAALVRIRVGLLQNSATDLIQFFLLYKGFKMTSLGIFFSTFLQPFGGAILRVGFLKGERIRGD